MNVQVSNLSIRQRAIGTLQPGTGATQNDWIKVTNVEEIYN